jgi:hypothetical protein
LALVGRPGCHLCDEAREVVAAVASDFGVSFAELSITDDPMLADEYFELIPVVLLDGAIVAHWWVDEAQLRAAMPARPGSP